MGVEVARRTRDASNSSEVLGPKFSSIGQTNQEPDRRGVSPPEVDKNDTYHLLTPKFSVSLCPLRILMRLWIDRHNLRARREETLFLQLRAASNDEIAL